MTVIIAFRLLHRHSAYGYTNDPHYAMHHEPEAIDHATQEHQTWQAHHAKHEAWRHHRNHILEHLEQMLDTIQDPHVTRTVRAIERELAAQDRRI